ARDRVEPRRRHAGERDVSDLRATPYRIERGTFVEPRVWLARARVGELAAQADRPGASVREQQHAACRVRQHARGDQGNGVPRRAHSGAPGWRHWALRATREQERNAAEPRLLSVTRGRVVRVTRGRVARMTRRSRP